MHAWHQRTLERLQQHFATDPRYLALILVGSVARREAGEASDLDLVGVLTDAEYARCLAARGLILDLDAFCDVPGGHASAMLVDYDYLLEAVERADERTRFQFIQAQVIFSRLPNLPDTLAHIAAYPEDERLEKMKSFYSQLPLHFSFMELAEYSQNAYLLAETAVALVLYGGRLILAYNRMLYPNRKGFMRALENTPDKPPDFMQRADRLLRQPGIANARAFLDCIMNYTDWPQPEEGAWQRIHQDSVWNWRTGSISLAER
jgi:hypothetical protein